MKKNFSFLYLLPQLFFTGLFLLALFLGLWDSFTVEGHASIAHYKEIFTRGDTLPSIFYTLRISFLSSLFTLLLAILCSFLILHFSEKWDSLKSILQLAIIMPHSLVALFLLFFLSQNGFMARIFYALKLISDQSAFPEFVYDRFGVGVILGYIWKELPFMLFFALPLAYSVDGKLGEAARTMGASPLYSFFFITLPLSIRQYLAAFFIIFSFSFGSFDLPYLLGNTTERALSVLAYQELQRGFMNRPTALSYNGIMLLFSLLLSFFYFRFLPKKKG